MASPSSLSTIDSKRCLFVTLGCAKNEVDTDRMRALLTQAGYGESQDVEDADVIIVNTCSFLASATSESIETTLELADAVAEGVRTRPIVMCGCVPSRYGSALDDELPEVAAFVRADEEDDIVNVVNQVLGREVNAATYELSPQDVNYLARNKLRRSGDGEHLVLLAELDGGTRLTQVVALSELTGRLLEGVVYLLHIDRRDNIKT